ncbi:Zn-dependent hydrolase [Thermoleptolyngbya sichuanensis XZ-Cy5]|uniref:Zn-dependent hydrolase n=1 Tax=Thermoleptolyngbya sichuanensis TaxID=2885951 RepID=UPI00240CEABD|nr:Zn-dependent hydrolase [Thermoleptolyngbya sichuanensis]MDG2617581.1 Zn-dependent hydrolase [Thermoleptolyngbya sichuanensis XZ-Cy5]
MVVLSKQLAVNGDRLMQSIDRLAKIGRQPNGDICRLAFSPEDLQARYLVQQWMIEAGMTVRTDAAGNLIGRYEGTDPNAPALATGSHIDTVPSGGPFDGALGVLGGIEVVRTLKENSLRLRHPIEVIVFTDEESSMIGGQAIAGTVLLDQPERYLPKIDQPIESCLEKIGGDWSQLPSARRTRADIAAFVELHVEQGCVLERKGQAIGVVQGVVGMQRHLITIHGQPNHAGTTPMDMRQDALIAAAKVILSVQAIALEQPSQPVATVGYLTVAPNAMNIVPGTVELSVDMRDLSQVVLEQMLEKLKQTLREIAIATHTRIDIAPVLTVEPTLASLNVQAAIEAVSQDLNLSYLYMPSRAGHDAMEMGRFTDMGMIFVPSQEGLSHSGMEYTLPEQCTQGADVLLHTLIKLDPIYA